MENITYMCTKVKIENEGAVTSGCFLEYQNGREIEVCVCKSTQGELPCNEGTNKSYFRLGIIYLVLFNIVVFNIFNVCILP